jgi:hypothetical protein
MHVRTNISLPSELHNRMRRLGRRVNWSALAAKVFEDRLLLEEGGNYQPPPPEREPQSYEWDE